MFLLAATATEHSWFHEHMPSHWPAQADLLTWCKDMGPAESTLIMLLGVVYMLWGMKIFKYLVMVNAALLGIALGALAGESIHEVAVGAVMGGIVLGAVSWMLMKYAVAVMGGVFGAIAGAGLWRAFNQPPDMAWAGAMTGLVLFGLTAFLLFNHCVMVFMALQGSCMFMMGIMGLAMKYPDVVVRASRMLKEEPFLVPMGIFIPAIIGVVFQHVSTHGHNAPSGSGGGGGGSKKK